MSGDRSCQKDQSTKERRAFKALITEISILSHLFIREHQNIVKLERVCWEIAAGDEKAWPVLVFEKAELGDLYQFMKSNAGKNSGFQRSLQLCSNIGGAIAAMHAGSMLITTPIHKCQNMIQISSIEILGRETCSCSPINIEIGYLKSQTSATLRWLHKTAI